MLEFPENKIVLLNGLELECYPKDASMTSRDDGELQVFLDNAFFFLTNAERIFKDSRMFLAPVPISSAVAYLGSARFDSPTLGVYLEWWQNSEADIMKDGEGNDALTYRIAGSPLSGINSCSCVYPDGSVKFLSHSVFLPVWRDLMRINKRYEMAKQRYESYSLQQVMEYLTVHDLKK